MMSIELVEGLSQNPFYLRLAPNVEANATV